MVFPDDEREANPASMKFLEMAHRWKKMQAAAKSEEGKFVKATTAQSASSDQPPQRIDPEGDSEMASSDGDE